MHVSIDIFDMDFQLSFMPFHLLDILENREDNSMLAKKLRQKRVKLNTVSFSKVDNKIEHFNVAFIECQSNGRLFLSHQDDIVSFKKFLDIPSVSKCVLFGVLIDDDHLAFDVGGFEDSVYFFFVGTNDQDLFGSEAEMDYRAPNGVFSGDERVLVFQEIKVFWIKRDLP